MECELLEAAVSASQRDTLPFVTYSVISTVHDEKVCE